MTGRKGLTCLTELAKVARHALTLRLALALALAIPRSHMLPLRTRKPLTGPIQTSGANASAQRTDLITRTPAHQPPAKHKKQQEIPPSPSKCLHELHLTLPDIPRSSCDRSPTGARIAGPHGMAGKDTNHPQQKCVQTELPERYKPARRVQNRA